MEESAIPEKSNDEYRDDHIRDYIAASAMTAISPIYFKAGVSDNKITEVAEVSYKIADAMIKQKRK